MKQIIVDLYQFSELSQEAKEHATEEYKQNVLWYNGYDWQDEFYGSIKAAEEAFNIDIEEDAWSNFYAHVPSREFEEMSFSRTVAYINNHLELKKPAYSYRCVLDAIKKRTANTWNKSIFYNKPALAKSHYEDNLPTGYCDDYCIINAYYKFIEEAKNAKVLAAVTMRSFLYILCDEFENAKRSDIEYQESIEAMEDRAEANDWLFYEDGTRCDSNRLRKVI